MDGAVNEAVCVVTGANSGVGFASAVALARGGARVVLLCRTRDRADQARSRARRQVSGAAFDVAAADLLDLDAVRRLGDALAARYPRIDLLVNNAGVYLALRQRTADGIEATFAVNHLSHFLLTQRLLPSLLAAGGRVVNVSSDGHRSAALDRASLAAVARGDGLYRGMRAYCNSKLANVLFTRELARRYPAERLCAVALHPGVLATHIWNRNWDPLSLFMRPFKLFMRRPAAGGEAVAFLAAQPAERVHGRYFDRQREAVPAAAALDDELAADLWQLSEALARAGTATPPG